MLYTQHDFPALESKPNWTLTWLIRVFFIFAILLAVLSAFSVPILLYIDGNIDGTGAVVGSTLYYLLILFLIPLCAQSVRKKESAVLKTTVDRRGVHYQKLDGSTESILYQALETAKSPLVFDVYIQSGQVIPRLNRYTLTTLKVIHQGTEATVDFNKTDVGYSYFSANQRELRSHFIQGIKIFRPDLRIYPGVYSAFFIHPETFEYDRPAHWTVQAAALLLAALTLLGIEIYMEYRFGDSLLF